MLLWIVFAVLTAGVVAALVRPWRAFHGASRAALDAAPADLALYRDQLTEIDLDRERGAIDAAEAEAAKAEVSRRILARASHIRGEDAGRAAADGPARAWALPAIATGVPLAAVMLYVAVGAPLLPDQPLTARATNPGGPTISDMIANVEARLKSHPEDGRGWDVIAPIYKGMRRYQDAAVAYANANRLLGESAKRLAGFAESEILANNGVVTENARKAAAQILALEPGRPDAKLWLALAKEQEGDLAGARDSYKAILTDDIPPGNLRTAVETRIASVEARLTGAPDAGPPAPAAPGANGAASAPPLSPDAVAALPPDEQAKVIESMVARLAARLDKEPGDVEGWLRLLNAYGVMGRKDAALAALVKARAGLAGDAPALARIEEAARSLGIDAASSAKPGGP
ncbi:MAG: c-type cytochrome biogenesis protein CcmI [Hyphomicrobium sp.]|nr:c-type cytochrome biogenesis protein CcmI [Hyphomicrobium sp.]